MLDYSIMQPEGIVVLKPRGQLSEKDFDGLAAAVDAHLSDHARIHGVLIPGSHTAPMCSVPYIRRAQGRIG